MIRYSCVQIAVQKDRQRDNRLRTHVQVAGQDEQASADKGAVGAVCQRRHRLKGDEQQHRYEGQHGNGDVPFGALTFV